jgi:hypothetical protein
MTFERDVLRPQSVNMAAVTADAVFSGSYARHVSGQLAASVFRVV